MASEGYAGYERGRKDGRAQRTREIVEWLKQAEAKHRKHDDEDGANALWAFWYPLEIELGKGGE